MKSPWSKAFLKIANSEATGARLQNGRSYAISGRVSDLTVNERSVTASVQGSRSKPYSVKIDLKYNNPTVMRKIISDIIQETSSNSVEIVLQELMEKVGQAKTGALAALMPEERNLSSSCSCPDNSLLCKHIVAVLYVLGSVMDNRPLVFLKFIGFTIDTIKTFVLENKVQKPEIEALKSHSRNSGIEHEILTGPDSSTIDSRQNDLSFKKFWGERLNPGEFAMSPERPVGDAQMISGDGEPGFWVNWKKFTEMMKTVYGANSNAGIKLYEKIIPKSASDKK